MRILLVDDDRALVELLTKTLSQQNYAIDVATDGEQGWIFGSTYIYDLIILDWSLPELDGIELCQRFRAHNYDTPIILLTSRGGTQNKIRGLDAGADDYICKPFDVEELTARIRALLRRLTCDFLPILRWGDLILNPCTSEVIYQGQSLSLTAKEYRLLELFLRHSQEVFSVEDIIDRLWSSTEYPAIATVRSHIRRLREKLKLVGSSADIIITVRGQGYCLKPLTNHKSLVEEAKSIAWESELERRSQHLSALSLIWQKHQPKRLQQLASLEQAIAGLQAGELEISDRMSAIVVAHSLAGNLGQFGLDRGSQLAETIEHLLQNNPSQKQAQELTVKLTALREEITSERDISWHINQTIADSSPLLLVVGEEPELTSKAKKLGMRIQAFSQPKPAKLWIEEQNNNSKLLPQVVLLKISFANDELSRIQEYLELIAEFKLLEPYIPVIVIADRDRFQDRLLVTRHGGSFYLSQPLNPSQIIAFCQQALHTSSLGKKIMIVDDDEELLQLIPSLLQPWGFKITTLDDPRQFWDVLQAVAPDLLILDIVMPHLSGIELCQVLRTHTSWQNLPVLFLSIHADAATSDQVFASGANDFVNKPVAPKQLAQRILNRLNTQVITSNWKTY